MNSHPARSSLANDDRHLLIIGYVWPEPRSSAAGSRMVQLIEFFRSHAWHITFASAANLSEHRLDLTSLGIAEHNIALNCASFDEYLQALQPDAVMFDRFFTEEQFGWRVAKSCPQALRILNTEDLHSLRHVRQQLLKQQQKTCTSETQKLSLGPVTLAPHMLYQQMADDDMAQREIAAIFRSDLSLIISTFELALLREDFAVPAELLLYCPFLLEPTQPTTKDFAARQHFVTIGNFRHEPNWDAVRWLKTAIWPRIRAALPQAQLFVYGAYPPPKATALHNPRQGFHIAGWADDALAVMSQARVCLAPLRFGAGIKGKLIDAMQCATPSVTTSIGAEAMHAELPWPGKIADDVAAFADAAVALYDDEKKWLTAQQQCRMVLETCFNKQELWGNLQNKIVDVFANLEAHRRQNFIGRMLQHHQHKSTQYMGQWIEAKNKIPLNPPGAVTPED